MIQVRDATLAVLEARSLAEMRALAEIRDDEITYHI
jgi:hypothetical protein